MVSPSFLLKRRKEKCICSKLNECDVWRKSKGPTGWVLKLGFTLRYSSCLLGSLEGLSATGSWQFIPFIYLLFVADPLNLLQIECEVSLCFHLMNCGV